jgi:hypothetical protein
MDCDIACPHQLRGFDGCRVPKLAVTQEREVAAINKCLNSAFSSTSCVKVTRVRNITALLLLTLWPAITSHPLLEHFELIHHVHADHDGGDGSHEHGADDHVFADGDYLRGSKESFVGKYQLGIVAILLLPTSRLIVAPSHDLVHSSPSPPGTAPPHLVHRWQFSFRAALPVRAPSCIS